ncbi:MAG: heme/copper-type cytochrome/quinol oxidase subunit 3 [Acidimicrobiales bacterium]|jgi:heme/copper-type cytochrome/quinol oxidase subunit 3
MTDVVTPDTTDDHDHDDHGGGHHSSLGLSNMKLAFWLFLGSECLLFGALISTFLLSKTRFITEVVAGNPKVVSTMPAELMLEFQEAGSVEPMFDIPFTSLSSFVLLMSSLAMVLGHSAVLRNDHKNTRIWIGTTALLGSIFIGGQIYEFTAFYREGLGYTGNLFGSAFYTLTGFHGIHVSVGIVMLLSILFLSFKGKLNSDRAETVELVGLYWHFVDIVWVLIFTIVYLIP